MDYKKCRNRIIDKLVEECTKIVDENKIYNATLSTTSSNDSLGDCVSCTPYIVLFPVILITGVIICGVKSSILNLLQDFTASLFMMTNT